MQTTLQGLEQRKADALKLLQSHTNLKAIALRGQIEAIDPATATRREIDQLEALCRKVQKFNSGELSGKQFGRQPSFDPRQRPQNPRGSRGRHG